MSKEIEDLRERYVLSMPFGVFIHHQHGKEAKTEMTERNEIFLCMEYFRTYESKCLWLCFNIIYFFKIDLKRYNCCPLN